MVIPGYRPGRVEYADQVAALTDLMSGRAPAGAVDPGRLLRAAGYHRVLGYVVDAAERGDVDLSQDARRRLAGQRLDETVKCRLLRREAEQILPVLEAACGVAPVLIKGPAVADRVYPDPRLRPFRDLDFVLPTADLAGAAATLTREFGYRRLEEPWPGYGELHGHHAALGRQAGASALVVELHWRITTDPAARRLDHRFLARTSHRLILDAASVPVPGPAAQLLVLACHLLHEGEKRLLWINDLNLAARVASAQDWEAAFVDAEELGLTWVLHRALDYPQQYLGLDRPRPSGPGSPPPWGPFRANEAFDGWLAAQVGQLSLGGWTGKEGYLRSALRARRRKLGARLRRAGSRQGVGSRVG